MNSIYFTPKTTRGFLTRQVTGERAMLGTYNVWEEVAEHSTQISGEHKSWLPTSPVGIARWCAPRQGL